MAGFGVVTKWDSLTDFLRTMPLMRLMGAITQRASETPVPQYKGAIAQAPDAAEPEETLRTVISRYVNNMRQVKAVAETLGIVPAFVWQPIPTYKYDLRYHVFNPDRLGCHVNSKVGYPLLRGSTAAGPLGRSFIWAADMQQALAEPLYVDAFHYTAPMSRRVAQFINSAVRERGLLSGAERQAQK
jgi:hypothetical protein